MSKCHKENCQECMTKEGIMSKLMPKKMLEHISTIENYCDCDDWVFYPEEYCDNCKENFDDTRRKNKL